MQHPHVQCVTLGLVRGTVHGAGEHSGYCVKQPSPLGLSGDAYFIPVGWPPLSERARSGFILIRAQEMAFSCARIQNMHRKGAFLVHVGQAGPT